MNFNVIIPARYASTRFPGKPLKQINGKAMVCHVIDRAVESGADRIVVATDHQEIFTTVEAYGHKVVMTDPNHPSGTDRLQQAAQLLGLNQEEIVVNVQGDEPLISPKVIRQVALNLAQNPTCSVSTLYEPIMTVEDFFNPNVVKLTHNNTAHALYFSRAPIPWNRDELSVDSKELPKKHPGKRHLGIYAYLVNALNGFVTWPEGNLEQIEKLEQLRFIENGHSIHVDKALVMGAPGVDTPEDLKRVEALLAEEN